MMSKRSGNKKVIWSAVLILAVFVSIAFSVWYKTVRQVPQPSSITAHERDNFLYGWSGSADAAGIPYWIWLALPRIFPEYLPGPGGYASLGVSWEETKEMPVGFAKKTVGYVRVAGNCALCHAYSRSNGEDAAPTVFAAGTGHLAEAQKLSQFFEDCAKDPRFNAANLLGEIGMATKLSFVDRLLYRFILIPRTRQHFLNKDPLLVDQALWNHAQGSHRDKSFRDRLQVLERSLAGEEQAALASYLRSLP